MPLLDEAIIDRAPVQGADRLALIMLPGAKNTPQQLQEYGFIRALRERELPIDVFALPAHADYYLETGVIERLLHEALDDVLAQGYRRLWLMGISLGGLGAMLCATQRPAEIEGVLLLAPFLGTRGVIAEVVAAGGLKRWQWQDDGDPERAFLAKLAAGPFDAPQFPAIHLGYGLQDQYMAASELLAACLPSQRVLPLSGGHDWETWQRLWQALLERSPFFPAAAEDVFSA